MTKKSCDHKKILNEILTSRNFKKLSQYSEGNRWTRLNGDERELLGMLLVMQGEEQLNKGEEDVLNSFKLANEVAPENPLVLYRQAQAFAKQVSNLFCLKAACKIFSKATEIKPNFFDAWHGWANTLVYLGTLTAEEEHFQEALEVFGKAEKLIENISRTKQGSFYRDWGLCHFAVGKRSEEPVDYKNAISKFDQAAKCGMKKSEFWDDFGKAHYELSGLIQNPELLIVAIEFFWKAVKLEPNYYDGWVSLALSLQTLYQLHPQDAYFTLANESFEKATNLNPQSSSVWKRWGHLQALRGRLKRDIKQLHEACSKFEVADVCEPNHPDIISGWGEILLLIGSWTDHLELIYESQKKILQSLEIQPDQPRVWFLYGSNLNEVGRYFEDESYYRQAITQFRQGLKFDKEDYLLWYGLSLSFFALGQRDGNEKQLEEARRYCKKAIDKGGKTLPHFWNDYGITQLKLGQIRDDKRLIEAASQNFEQALRMQAQSNLDSHINPEWLYNYACALQLLGDHNEDVELLEKAVHTFKKILEIQPGNYAVYFNLGTTFALIGDLTWDLEPYSQANMWFEEYAKIDTEDDMVWNEWGMVLISMAELLKEPANPNIEKKLLEQAEMKLHQAIALGNQSSFYNLACLYSLNGNVSASMHFLERAYEEHYLPPIEDIMKDNWLENTRQTRQFQEFLNQINEVY